MIGKILGVVARQVAKRTKLEQAVEDRWTPSLDDRRRLAVAEVFLIAERQEGLVYPSQFGGAVLNHAVSEEEVSELADATVRTVGRRIERGQLG